MQTFFWRKIDCMKKKKNKYKQWLKNLSLACNNDIWLLVILLFFVVWIKGQLCPNWMPMPENEVFSGSRVSCSGLKPLGKKIEELRFCCRRKEGRLSGDKWRRSTSRQNTMTPTLFIARSPMKNCVFYFFGLIFVSSSVVRRVFYFPVPATYFFVTLSASRELDN